MRVLLIFIMLGSIELSASEDLPDAFIYSKSACFGTCPIYQVIVFADGTVIFNGKDYVQHKGFYKLQKSPDLYQEILLITEKFNINAFENNYGYPNEKICKQRWTDNPTTTLHLQQHGKVKIIQHYQGCKGFDREGDLKAMEIQIDKILNLETYIGK